jgi:hypothetical protein
LKLVEVVIVVGLVGMEGGVVGVVEDPCQDRDPWQDDDHEEEIGEEVVEVAHDRTLDMASLMEVPVLGSDHVVEEGLDHVQSLGRMDSQAEVVD